MFSSMIPKNNPFFVRFSESVRYEGLCMDSRHSHGYCRFVDPRYAVKAIAGLLMVKYRKRGFKNYASLLSAYGLSFYAFPYIGTLELNKQFEFAELIFQIGLHRSGSKVMQKLLLNPDSIYEIIRSFNIVPYGQSIDSID